MAYRKIDLTEEDLKNMADEYIQGKSLREISESFGLSVSAVRRKLVDRGITMRPKGRPLGSTHVIKLSMSDRQTIIESYKDGASSAELAEKYSVTKERICQICRAANVIRTRGESKDKDSEESSE